MWNFSLVVLATLALGSALGVAVATIESRWSTAESSQGRARFNQVFALFMTLSIYAVVLVMGMGTGAQPHFAQQWSALLTHSLIFGVLVSVCTVATVELALCLKEKRAPRRREFTGEITTGSSLGGLFTLFFLVLGIGVGHRVPEFYELWIEPSRDLPLLVLLVLVGLDMGRQYRVVLAQMRIAGHILWMVPAALAGSLIGASLASLLLPQSFSSLLAGGAAAGWYSVAGPVVAELDGASAGAVVLVGNIIRESLGMIFMMPMARKGLSPASGVALGGATALDTTLPFITRAWGPQSAVLAVSFGLIMSLLVPVLVPLVYSLF